MQNHSTLSVELGTSPLQHGGFDSFVVIIQDMFSPTQYSFFGFALSLRTYTAVPMRITITRQSKKY